MNQITTLTFLISKVKDHTTTLAREHVEAPSVLHALPRRMRLHLPGWSGAGQSMLETHLCQIPGVQRVQANSLTGNVLIHFDTNVTDQQPILEKFQMLLAENSELTIDDQHAVRPVSIPSLSDRSGRPLEKKARHLLLLALGFVGELALEESPLGLIVNGVEVVCFILDLIGQPALSYSNATESRQRSLANNSSAAALSLMRGNKAA